MNRRDFLAGTAASLPLALAGCLGTGSGGDDDPTQTQTPEHSPGDGPFAVGDEVGLGDDRALTVADFDASAFVVSRDGADRTVHSGKTTRYVHVALKPDGIDDREAFAADNVTLVVNDEEFGDPVFPLGGGPSQFVAAYPVPTDVTPYTASVEVDTGDGETASWEIDARGIESITQTVDYAVADVSLPDAVEPGAEFTAELTVSNNGDAMEFVVQYRGGGNTGRETLDVPAGEESTLELDLTAPSDPGGDDGFGVTLEWGARGVTELVLYEESTTTTTASSE
ncbi:hypothetical protein [Halobacterium rubrum]|uniref:hypothetical protein n=1 Tax=Halobacterium TaxID=2239 RepID=UPI001F457874|nr:MULTISPECIES: hypothetical protein [Halobacterium]MDH5021540.1 hypothetical protein [Halobacterium rubrum]